MIRKDFSSMNDYDEARKTSYREVRYHWIDIVENYNQQSVTLYGKTYGKVQYRTPIPPHVPVKVNTVTCAGKGFVTSNIHDELPHSFFSTMDNSNYLQCLFP